MTEQEELIAASKELVALTSPLLFGAVLADEAYRGEHAKRLEAARGRALRAMGDMTSNEMARVWVQLAESTIAR